MSASTKLFFNGVDAATGQYLLPPCAPEDLLARLSRTDDAPAHPPQEDPLDRIDPKRVPLVGVDTRDLEQTGWGIVYPPGLNPGIRRRLEPLVDLRRRQLERRPEAFHEIYLRPGENPYRLLDRVGRAGGLRPEQMPYYLLLVGGPEGIPYDFQLEVNGSYAVGRIAFERPEEYGTYAERVVRHSEELRPPRLPRDVSFFSVYNRGDRATQRLTEDLAGPLADRIEKLDPRFRVHRILGRAATRERLLRLFSSEVPALLFTASHGLGYSHEDPRQRALQGSLLCSDMDGPFVEQRPVPREAFFCADDVPAKSTFDGLVAVHFACYGAGTPEWDSFAQARGEPQRRRCYKAFVASLPQRLLAHDRGALAVVGHVDQAWTTSFSWGEGSEPLAFEEMIKLLLQGQPVGASLEPLRALWAYLSRRLNDIWQTRHRGAHIDTAEFTHVWTADRDVMSYVILGDPAVRLAVRGH